jgi:hypothetical protein
MTLLNELKSLIQKYGDDAEESYPYKTVGKSAPKEWRHLPIDEKEGRRVILEALRNHQDLPWDFISQAHTGSIHFDCGPITKESYNPNGYCHTSGYIHFIDALYAALGVKVEGDRA